MLCTRQAAAQPFSTVRSWKRRVNFGFEQVLLSRESWFSRNLFLTFFLALILSRIQFFVAFQVVFNSLPLGRCSRLLLSSDDITSKENQRITFSTKLNF